MYTYRLVLTLMLLQENETSWSQISMLSCFSNFARFIFLYTQNFSQKMRKNTVENFDGKQKKWAFAFYNTYK